MQEISPRVALVHCPKCHQLLPELPIYSIYSCGGCGALLRAAKRSSVDDGLSDKSWERIGEGYGENVGFDSGRGSDRSPLRSRYGEATMNSSLRESDSSDLGSGRQSSTKRTVLGDFDLQSKSSGRSIDGDLGLMESVGLDERYMDDPSWPQYPGRAPHGRPHYYPRRSAHDYIPHRSVDSTYDPSRLAPRNEIPHHLWSLRTNVQAPPAFGHRSYLNPKTDMVSDFADPYGESAPGSRFLYSTPPKLSSQSQRSVDSKIDGGGSARKHGKWLLTVNKHQLCCHPIAGAAPFVLCYNCSLLLRVPRKLITMKNTQLSHFRLLCGSCRTMLSFSFDKKPRASMQLQPKPSLTNVDDVPSKMSESDHKISLAIAPAGITESESYEFDKIGYTFQSTDSEMSQNSTEVSSKNDGNKIEKSSSAGIVARDFRDMSQPTDTSNAKADVFVNGQLLPNRVVRKAEKLAGPISPGKYWYDSRAGFWGVMGSYCLGIIPPFIQEFEFPMSVNCAGGTTGIYVNGRELHENDLRLLASRQFPLTGNKWYVIDISGKVEDEETGDTVVNMGKLAPSVEKAKHGFGMHSSEMQTFKVQ